MALKSKFIFDKTLFETDIFKYLNTDDSIIGGFDIDNKKNIMYIKYNTVKGISLPEIELNKYTYYDNRFLWNIVKNKLVIDQEYIENIEINFFRIVPNYIDIYNYRIYNYDDVRGRFVQTIDE